MVVTELILKPFAIRGEIVYHSHIQPVSLITFQRIGILIYVGLDDVSEGFHGSLFELVDCFSCGLFVKSVVPLVTTLGAARYWLSLTWARV